MSAGRTVLVTGGGSGIGAGLAGAFHTRGAEVIIAGRTESRLQAVAARHPGMAVEVVDVADAAAVESLARRVARDWPGLDTVVSNAGIQTLFDFAGDARPDSTAIAREIDVNLKGVIHVAGAFLPLLQRMPEARLIHVGSGLGYVPLAAAPVYSATKAALHSFTISLRHQLRGTGVRVIELIPPVVETDLHRGQARRPPRAMPLDAFVAAAMAGLDSGKDVIPIGLAKVLRTGSSIAPGFFFRIINKARDR
jgi:uncharacterized oxidoreductase